MRLYASQNAPRKQDAVTTHRDHDRTCRDVPAQEKPSIPSYAPWESANARHHPVAEDVGYGLRRGGLESATYCFRRSSDAPR
jgi:hypothetical protein